MNKKDNPGVRIPPPLIYAAFFVLSIFLQKEIPLGKSLFSSTAMHVAGVVLIGCFVICVLPAMLNFFQTKNTIITVKPASSLTTSGIYSITRNPMYLGLVCLYCGIAFLKGNWWTFILLPFLIIIVQLYVIRREEHYLSRAFGADYDAYKQKVRRWI
jgi:protein-S-isoprenylcysteine O-methyltransferase Ste14